MTPVYRPRGPLPARVYWTRRVLVLTLALALVFGLAHVLGAAGGPGEQAATVAGGTAGGASPSSAGSPQASPSAREKTAAEKAEARAARKARRTKRAAARDRAAEEARLEQAREAARTPPSGTCTTSDLVATPEVRGDSYAGGPVRFRITLTTLTNPACTWTASKTSLVVRVTSGSDPIWTTQECLAAIPTRNVVVRPKAGSYIEVIWRGQRSNEGCTRSAEWAEPGWYHVDSAVYGGEAADLQFELRTPPRPTITLPARPKKSDAATGEDTKTDQKKAAQKKADQGTSAD